VTSDLDCDDGNPCTLDTCDPSQPDVLCINTPLNGVDCDDEQVCTSNDTCVNGTCTGTPIPFCIGLDCNGNGIDDGTDMANCPPATPWCDDCNGNGYLDECDIYPEGPSSDGNGNGIPDECEGGCTVDEDCDDASVCTDDECDAGTCLFIDKRYGDIDRNGFITLADLFCVLDGFGGDFSVCSKEQDDIHGACPLGGNPCCPNGSIGLADLFAVLDAFGGEDPCCTP